MHSIFSVPDSERIDCNQGTFIGNKFVLPTFAHTQCEMYCECGSNGVTVKTCPENQAWDKTQKQCTPGAYTDCTSKLCLFSLTKWRTNLKANHSILGTW